MVIGRNKMNSNIVMFDGGRTVCKEEDDVGSVSTSVTRHGFKTAMAKTIPNPLDPLTRKDYIKNADKLREGDDDYAISIDREAETIQTALGSIMDIVYDGLNKIAKKKIASYPAEDAATAESSVVGTNANALADAMADGRRAVEKLERRNMQLLVTDNALNRQNDLYAILHLAAMNAVQENREKPSPALHVLEATCRNCLPTREPSGDDMEVVRRVADQLADLNRVRDSYRLYEGEIKRLENKIRELRRNKVSRPGTP